jgi:hypothetical protein
VVGDIPWGESPFEQAVMHLFENPWCARFCPVCKKRFVAAHSKNKFCSSECSEKDRRRQKREWFRHYGKEWREKHKKQSKREARAREKR